MAGLSPLVYCEELRKPFGQVRTVADNQNEMAGIKVRTRIVVGYFCLGSLFPMQGKDHSLFIEGV
jgi:hypothetical protein